MKKSRIWSAAFFAILAAVCSVSYAIDPVSTISYLHSLSASDAGIAGLSFLGIGNTEIITNIKDIIQKQGEAFEQFKKTNDELIKAKADGKAVSDLEAKLDTISKSMDELSDVKKQLEDVMVKLQRPGAGGKSEEDLAAEVKGFNDMMRAEFQSKGKAIPSEMNAEQYTQYKSAFFKAIAHGPNALSNDELKTLSAGADPDGGYLLPTPTVGRMVARIYEQSVMRQLATVVPISTDALEGIIDNDEADAGWVSEMGGRDDTKTPQVGKYRIEAHEMYAQPKVTQKLIDDAATDVEGWLASKTADKFARVESVGFMTGDGAGKPRGLTSYPTVATSDDTRPWGSFEHILTGANGAFHATTKADPIQDLIGAFKDQYLQNASFLMRREVRTAIRKLKESNTDRYLWEPSLQAGHPDRFMGYAARVDQYLPALAAGSLSLAFGDFKEAYTIVDRIGVRTLRDPYTAKPFIRFYSTKRTGGGAVNFEAVKFIKFGT